MVRTSAAWRFATHPRTKNVARALCRASRSSSGATWAATRDSKRFQSDRETQDSNAETWKYSSTSIVKWCAIIAAHAGASHRTDVERSALSACQSRTRGLHAVAVAHLIDAQV